MSTPITSIPGHNAFVVRRHQGAVILSEFEVSRMSAALQGAHALIAVLQQREFDADNNPGEGLAFDNTVALGLLAALATCTEYASDLAETGGTFGLRAEYGSDAYQHLEAARQRVLAAKRKGGVQ